MILKRRPFQRIATFKANESSLTCVKSLLQVIIRLPDPMRKCLKSRTRSVPQGCFPNMLVLVAIWEIS